MVVLISKQLLQPWLLLSLPLKQTAWHDREIVLELSKCGLEILKHVLYCTTALFFE